MIGRIYYDFIQERIILIDDISFHRSMYFGDFGHKTGNCYVIVPPMKRYTHWVYVGKL